MPIAHQDEMHLQMLEGVNLLPDAVKVTLGPEGRTLCENTRIECFGGQVRSVQNWVGGNSYNPLQADYTPPAPEHVMELLEDLTQYCNDEVISPVLQAVIIHA